jgi:hypothetical protein
MLEELQRANCCVKMVDAHRASACSGANSTEPESAIAATRPVPQPLFSGSPNYAGERLGSKMH